MMANMSSLETVEPKSNVEGLCCDKFRLPRWHVYIL